MRRLACALALAAAIGCETFVEGNGILGKSDRSAGVAAFAGVRVDDAIQATVTVSDGSEKFVEVNGDANLLEYIRTDVVLESVLGLEVAVLHVWVDVPSDYSRKLPMGADVHMPTVQYLSAREAASVDTSGATATDLVVDASAGGRIVVAGTGGAELHATVRDATVDAGAYPVDHAGVALWGRSQAILHAGQVSGEAHGTSTVENLLETGACTGVAVFDNASVECPSAP